MKLGFFGNDYKLGVVKGDNIVDVSSVAKEYGSKPQDQNRRRDRELEQRQG